MLMTSPNGRPNLEADACPGRSCERLCGPGDLCKCPPCLCPSCAERRRRARARAAARTEGDAELASPSVLSLFD